MNILNSYIHTSQSNFQLPNNSDIPLIQYSFHTLISIIIPKFSTFQILKRKDLTKKSFGNLPHLISPNYKRVAITLIIQLFRMWPHMLGAAEKDMTQSSKNQDVLMAAEDVNCACFCIFTLL